MKPKALAVLATAGLLQEKRSPLLPCSRLRPQLPSGGATVSDLPSVRLSKLSVDEPVCGVRLGASPPWMGPRGGL